MSATAVEILEQFRKLPLPERRELVEKLVKEAEPVECKPTRRRTVADIAGKFPSNPDPEAKDHDRWFAEAILASKRGDDEP
jgi:hypothetical protein